MPFVPRRVIFEEAALDYPTGKNIWDLFYCSRKIELEVLKAKQRITKIPGLSLNDAYQEAKRTLVVGVRKTLAYQSCKPSAHYQLPLVSGCVGNCEYCYLNTQFGRNPYVRVYVNVDEILEQAAAYIESRKPDITIFEGAATSDPVPVEPYTKSLAKTIDFFAHQEYGRFRFVTKFTDIDSLLNTEHKNKTEIRFSINANHIIKSYEHSTPSLSKRLIAAGKLAQAGYPLGFIIGPVILFEGWEEQYKKMLKDLQESIQSYQSNRLSFEIISHRFTSRAKTVINEIYPGTTLPMNEEARRFKYGQFGYGKYIYTPEQMNIISEYFKQILPETFPGSKISYII